MMSESNGLSNSTLDGISGSLVIAHKKVGRGRLSFLDTGVFWIGVNDKSFNLHFKDVQSSAKSSSSSDGTEGEDFLLMAVGVSPEVLSDVADDTLEGEDSENESEADYDVDSHPGCILQFFPDDNKILEHLYTKAVEGIKRNSTPPMDPEDLANEDSEVDGMYDDNSDDPNGGSV